MSPAELSPQQREAIVRSFGDHEAFCLRSLRLRERDGSKVPLTFWPSQRKLTEVVRRQQKRGQPVRVLILKTRRSGFTVGSCSHVFRECALLEGRRGVVIADKYDPAALEAFGYFKSFFGNYQPFGEPGASLQLRDYSTSDADMKIRGKGGEDDTSIIDVYSADRGEIRGGGRHWALFDEVAFWRDAQTTLRAAMSMIPPLPDTGIFIQSTANGVGGEFYERCQQAQNPALANGFEFLFFGWLEDVNNRMAVAPDEAVKLQRSLDREEQHLHAMLGATIEQLAWRRWKILNDFGGKVDDFHQEYPTTPQEAFLTTGRPRLDHAALARMPISAGTPGELELVEVYPRKRIQFLARDHGPLTIWQQPEPGETYVIGADPAKGIDVSEAKRGQDPDYAVAFVANRRTGVQVALLRERLRPAAFADYLSLLCKLYNNAFLVPEANDAGFIDALMRTQYPLELIYARGRMPDDLRPPAPGQIGYETNTVSRPQLISAVDEAIREMSITIRSPIVVQECRTFVVKPDGKAEHQTGCHDDTVFAAALAVIGLRVAPSQRFASEGNPSGVRRYGQAGRRGN